MAADYASVDGYPLGLHHNIPFETYLRLPAISSHGLMLIERSPMHYQWAQEDAAHATSSPKRRGTLAHELVLTPEQADHILSPVGVNPTRNADKARLIEHICTTLNLPPPEVDVEGPPRAVLDAQLAAVKAAMTERRRYLISDTELATAQAMRDAVMAQPFARALLADGDPEVTMLWERDGVSCKARADWVCGGHQVIVDLKTAADAGEQGFRRAVGQWKYHLQAAHYIDAARATGLGERTFVFIVVESEPPHGVALYQLGEREVHAGGVRIRRAMDAYRECIDTGHWPGYPTEISPIELAPWAL
ncbi:hypothetical protein AY586_14765 [Marichromatium gracile]|uniref:Putative exodeoxyribonuclease 8 PDDEXK-like domain-containing protein n=1 Tax=Marichromatium gracile TaxID=1048 RepID=A0ABR5VF86_MARGR|nr:hypothetical protein AY586_14765 [Marichromatium gracile]